MKPREYSELGVLIEVDALALAKLQIWVDMAKGEISALGLVEETTDESTGKCRRLRITDFYLVRQVCSSAETTMEPAAVAELLASLEQAGIDSGKLRCWAHSHADMQTFWSTTDQQCIIGLSNREWLLSLVVNKRRQSLMRMDQFHPAHLWIDNVRWEVNYPISEEAMKQCAEEFTAKVVESVQVGMDSLLTSSVIDALSSTEKRRLEELQTDLAEGRITQDEFDDHIDWAGLGVDAAAYNSLQEEAF